MHVGVNARAFSLSDPGGDVQCGIRLIEALASRNDVNLTLFGHPSVDELFPDATVASNYFYVDSQEFGVLWEQFALPRLVHEYDVDVLFCPNGNGPARSVSVPVVTCLHDVFAYRGYAGGLYSTLQQVRLPRIVRHSDAMTTVSEFSKQEITDAFAIDPSEITVVYNGIDGNFLDCDDTEPIETPANYLLFVGGMNHRKNFSGLVDAFEILRSEYDCEHELVLAGPGEKNIYANVDANLERDALTHLGFVSEPQLRYLYTNADLFLFPSLMEGFGVPPLEAMACGTAVVSSDLPCMPEVLDDAAAFTDPTDPDGFAATIYEVLTDDEFRRELVERGRTRAGQFTWERAAAETVQVLREVAE